MKKAYIIVGLGYGDEGKGLTTDYLCMHSSEPIVIRYNGGQQAGHTVVTNNEVHVFSNFGAGTFRGVPTYWSSYCTFSPNYFIEEFGELSVKPKLYLDFFCSITTHYDVLYNRALEDSRGDKRYGSCGVGFGATVTRHQELSTKIIARDLLDLNIVKAKLKKVREYYRSKIEQETNYNFSDFDHDTEDRQFEIAVEKLNDLMISGFLIPKKFRNDRECSGPSRLICN
ncbi:MAG: hypothetical protein EOO43_05190 [Flavobacterium sp.]|nr:MAG: hypothetical protein EOO43_05190 [Flavobacterium sp.]